MNNDLTEDYIILPTYFYVNTGNINASVDSAELSKFCASLSHPNVIAQSKLFTDRFFLIKENGVFCPGVELTFKNNKQKVLGKDNVHIMITGIEDCTNRMERVLKIERISR